MELIKFSFFPGSTDRLRFKLKVSVTEFDRENGIFHFPRFSGLSHHQITIQPTLYLSTFNFQHFIYSSKVQKSQKTRLQSVQSFTEVAGLEQNPLCILCTAAFSSLLLTLASTLLCS